MKISHYIKETICVLNIEGLLNEEVVGEFRRYTNLLVEDQTIKGIVANLHGMTYIDSSGIGSLIEFFKNLKKREATLMLCEVNKHTQETFKMVRLDNVLNIQLSEEEALQMINK